MSSSSFNDIANIRRRPWRGLTVMEILITTAIALLLLSAIIQAFVVVSDKVSRSRAILELSGQLRPAAETNHEDLKGLTAPARSPLSPSSGLGYLEYVEFAAKDWDADADGNADVLQAGAETSIGDWDDVLMLTARAQGKPFVGQWRDPNPPIQLKPLRTIESELAEIVWFTHIEDRNGNGVQDPGERWTLYRRVLLIRPDLTLHQYANMNDYYADNDVSARVQNGTIVPNSLADLTKRENRYAHFAAFPHALNVALVRGRVLTNVDIDINNDGTIDPTVDFLVRRRGEDVVLSGVLAFDVRVFDPTAPIVLHPGNDGTVGTPAGAVDDFALSPGDPGYAATLGGGAPVIGRGAYVDLNYLGNSSFSYFSGAQHVRSQLAVPTYCTWSTHYESDGINQLDPTGNVLFDEGTNGLDDDGINGVDDLGENETSPPYPVPLRGIEVRIRVLERDTQQVRQVSVVSDFIPE